MSDEQIDSERKELADFEKAVFSELKPEAEDPILDLPPADLPSEDPGTARPTPTPAASAPAPATPAPTPATPEEGATGDVRAALRAARRAERQAREEARQLREQLAARGGPAREETEADHDLADLEVNVPQAANLVKKLQAQIAELTSKVAAPNGEPAPAAPAFVPDTLPPELQTAVEAVPQIEDWQHDPDQTAWTLAKRMDGLLVDHPAWKGRPVVDRLKEVARRVRAELGAPSTPPAAERAGRVIENAPERGIETLSDLRGGAAPTNQGPDFHSMKSDDEVMAALTRL